MAEEHHHLHGAFCRDPRTDGPLGRQAGAPSGTAEANQPSAHGATAAPQGRVPALRVGPASTRDWEGGHHFGNLSQSRVVRAQSILLTRED